MRDLVSNAGLKANDAKMMGQPSAIAFCSQVRGSVFLHSTIINDDRNALPCSKRAFSEHDTLHQRSRTFTVEKTNKALNSEIYLHKTHTISSTISTTKGLFI